MEGKGAGNKEGDENQGNGFHLWLQKKDKYHKNQDSFIVSVPSAFKGQKFPKIYYNQFVTLFKPCFAIELH